MPAVQVQTTKTGSHRSSGTFTDMKPKYLGWLLAATFLIWFTPWQAKQFFPSVFGSSYIQWASCIVSAPLLSIGLFLSVRALYTYPVERRDSGWVCVGFTTLFCLILGFYGLAGPMLSRLNHSVDMLNMADSMPRLMSKMLEAKTEKHRQNIAKVIYGSSGVTIPYQTDSGIYIIYSPTQEDTNNWTQTQAFELKRKETKALLEWQLKQLPWLTSLYIGSFFLTFSVGSLILIQRKTKSEP